MTEDRPNLDLRARARRPEDFTDDDEYQEAAGYWHSHQGRVIAMIEARRRRSQS
ncbi:hypothetical protein BH09PSE6_BH09PSE6_07290 [soil metagenome]